MVVMGDSDRWVFSFMKITKGSGLWNITIVFLKACLLIVDSSFFSAG